jgi:tetratricopeptide (TPR) repeat protein
VDPSPRVRNWLAGLAVLAAAVVPYLSTLGAGFVFDDHLLVENAPALRGPLVDLWLGRGVHDYWPLTWTSLWIDFRIFGAHPAGYHAGNVLLHAATAFVLWRALARLEVPGAWLGAVLFAVHPVAVESVAWISERKNVLSGLLFGGAILAWLRFDESGNRRILGASLGLFLLALLAKTSVVMLPVVLLLLVLYRRGEVSRRDVVVTLPYFALSLALGLVTVWYQWTRAVGEQTGAPRGLVERVGAAGWALLHYLRTAFLPVDLGLVYPEWPVAPGSAWFLAPALLVALAAAAGAWLWARSRPRWLLPFAYHAVMVLPVLGLVEIAYFYISPVANHLQYLALMGPAALGGAAVARLLDGRLRWAAIAGASALILLLGASSARRAAAFASDLSLWSLASAEQPGALFAAWSLADELGGAGRRAEALAVLERLERSAPDEATRLRARALLAVHDRRLEEAAAIAARAWDIRRSYTYQQEIGNLLLRAGRPDLAVAVLGPLVAEAPRYADARLLLVDALVRSGRREEAVRGLRDGIALDPENPRFPEALRALGQPR